MDYQDVIASFGYGIYYVPENKIAIADPQDNSDGFYLVCDSIEECYQEMRALELISYTDWR